MSDLSNEESKIEQENATVERQKPPKRRAFVLWTIAAISFFAAAVARMALKRRRFLIPTVGIMPQDLPGFVPGEPPIDEDWNDEQDSDSNEDRTQESENEQDRSESQE